MCAGAHITKLTEYPVLSNPSDNIPADNYTVTLTATDSHGSRSVTTTTLTVLACPAPAGNRPPVPRLTGAPYTLAVCNGLGTLVMDASSSSELDAGDKIGRYIWEVAGADVDLELTGPTVTLDAKQGLYAGNTYEVEVYVGDSYGAAAVAETTLTGEIYVGLRGATGPFAVCNCTQIALPWVARLAVPKCVLVDKP